MDQSHTNRPQLKLALTVLAVIVIAGIIVLADHFKNGDKDDGAASVVSVTQPSATTTPTTTTPTATSASYKDGTYTAASDYYVPRGYENIAVTVTLKDGVVTSASVKNSEGDRDSALYQQNFAAVYKNYVVGKSINGLSLSRVSGASDTTQGFNDAIMQIANQAKV